MPSTCPNCGAPVLAGMIFCDECGTDLRTAQSVSPPVQPWTPEIGDQALPVYQPPIASTSQAVQASFYLPDKQVRLDFAPGKLEFIVGREDAISGVFPDIDLEPYAAQEAGVSRRHIKLFLQGSSFTVEDLNTVNGTFLNKQKLPPNQPASIKNGDELRLGKLVIFFNLE